MKIKQHGMTWRSQQVTKKSWASHHCDRRQRRNVIEMDKTDSRDKDGRPGQNWTEVRTRNQQIQITKIYEIVGKTDAEKRKRDIQK